MGQKSSAPLRPLTAAEREALVRYFDDNSAYLHYAARLFLSQPEDEEDLIQDCLLHIIRHIDTFLSLNDRRKNAYAARIIHNLCIDGLRRQKGRETAPLDGEIAEALPIPAERVPGSASHLALLDLARALPERDWFLLQELYLEGTSREQVAQALGCSPKSIRSMASRARAAARRILNSGERRNGEDG